MKSKKQVLGTETGKFCLDVAKLIIGGIVLASIVKENIDSMLLIGVGFIFVIFLTLVGLWLITRYKEEKEESPKPQTYIRRHYKQDKNRRN